MTYDPSLTTEWADGTYTFRLGFGELVKLQDAAAPDGPWDAFDRLVKKRYRVELVREVIRFALIGGGKTPVEAQRLIKTWVEDGPPEESRILAASILAAWMTGAKVLPQKKAQAAAVTGSRKARASTPRKSTKTPPSSA